eukprot:18270-Heterococcus_DN1.PRE.2
MVIDSLQFAAADLRLLQNLTPSLTEAAAFTITPASLLKALSRSRQHCLPLETSLCHTVRKATVAAPVAASGAALPQLLLLSATAAYLRCTSTTALSPSPPSVSSTVGRGSGLGRKGRDAKKRAL